LEQEKNALISLPKTQGIKDDIFVDRQKRIKRNEHTIPNQNTRKKLAGKGKILPPKIAALRAQTKLKRSLIKQIRNEDKKSSKSKPKGKQVSKKQQKKT